MKRYYVLFFLIGFISTGCVKQQVALSPENAGKINSTSVILVIDQEELEAEIERSNMAGAMGGGLLFALADAAVENSRSKSAEERISPLRSHLSDIDFRKELVAQLRQQLKGSWLHITNIDTTSALTAAERKKVFENKTENAVLIINANYKLTSNFKQLKTSAGSELLLNAGKEPIYKNNFSISSNEVSAKTEDQAVAQWAGNSGAPLRRAVHEGINKLAESIAQDVSPKSTSVVEASATEIGN